MIRESLARTTLEHLEIREGLEGLTPARIATLYRRAPLFRPIRDLPSLWSIYEQSSLVLSAWHNDQFVGIARVLSDGGFHSYLCDLAVEPDVQRLGVGRRLLQAVFERCKGTELIIYDTSVSAVTFEKFGFDRIQHAWIWRG